MPMSPEKQREYHRNRRALDNAQRKARRLRDPEKIRAQDRASHVRNRPRKLAELKRSFQRHRSARIAQMAASHAADPEKRNKPRRDARKAHPEEIRAAENRYRREHPEKRLEQNQRRRAQKANAPLNDLTHPQWGEIQDAQDHRCYYCGKRRKGKLTQDHIQPLSQGGSHTLHNVIGACQSCNSRKSTRPAPMPVQPLLLTIAPAKKRKASP